MSRRACAAAAVKWICLLCLTCPVICKCYWSAILTFGATSGSTIKLWHSRLWVRTLIPVWRTSATACTHFEFKGRYTIALDPSYLNNLTVRVPSFHRYTSSTSEIRWIVEANLFSDLDRETLTSVTQLLHGVNPYVQLYQQAREVEGQEFRLSFRSDGVDLRRYNRPTASEVGAILLDSDEAAPRDVVLRHRGGGLQRITELHSAYDPLSYPILFPFGTQGWCPELMQDNGQRNITLMQKSSYDLQIREENKHT